MSLKYTTQHEWIANHDGLATGLRQLRSQVIDLIGLRGETCPYKRLICWV